MLNTSVSSAIDALGGQIRVCTKCDLCHTRQKSVPGEGPAVARIMFVGEAPGKVNDETGRPFVGHGGRVFASILRKCRLQRSKVFVTNAVRCWPPGNRRPTPAQLATCVDYLSREVDLIKPACIFALGSTAFRALTGQRIQLRAEHGSIVTHGGRVVCPTFHPNGIRYIKGGMATIVADISGALATLKLDLSDLMDASPDQQDLLSNTRGF